MRRHLRIWVNHAAMNAGAALLAVWHIVLPPQVDHTKEQVDELATMRPHDAFKQGLGL